MYSLIDITQQLDLTQQTTKVTSVEEQMWVYHQILEPKIILVSEFEEFHLRGWERTPAIFEERRKQEQDQLLKKQQEQIKLQPIIAQPHEKAVVNRTDDQHKKEENKHKRAPDLESLLREVAAKKNGPNR